MRKMSRMAGWAEWPVRTCSEGGREHPRHISNVYNFVFAVFLGGGHAKVFPHPPFLPNLLCWPPSYPSLSNLTAGHCTLASLSERTQDHIGVQEKATAEQSVQMAKTRISWFMMLTTRDIITTQMLDHDHAGSGTPDDPYIVMFLENDPRDPMGFPLWLRWVLCIAAGYVTSSVAFISSAFSGSIRNISADLNASPESATLGLSLFLLGFVFGPLLWAPCSGWSSTFCHTDYV